MPMLTSFMFNSINNNTNLTK